MSSSQDKLDQELQHIKKALQHCQFPNWVLNQWLHKFTNPNQPTNHNSTNNTNQQDNNTYMPSIGDKFKKLCKNKGIQVHYKGTNTLSTLLGNPKDKDPQNNQTDIIYHYKCPQINCPHAYLGESGRSLEERVKEHFEAPSPIHLHSTTTGHPMDHELFNIVHKEVNSHSRTIRRPCSSTFRTQPSTETWESTSFCTYGTIFCRHPLHYSASHPAPQPHQLKPPTGSLTEPPSSPLPIWAGGTYFSW